MKHDCKKCETCGIKYNHCDCFLKYTNFKDDLIKSKCLSCYESRRKFDKKLIEILFNTYKFSNYDNNKFNLLLQKGVYPYKYMMLGKNSMKQRYLKKKIFIVTYIWKIL